MPQLQKLQTTRVVDAVWFDCTLFPPEPDPTDPTGQTLRVARVKLRRMNNPDYQKRRNALSEERKMFLRAGGQYAEDASQAIVTECVAETVVVDWEHFYDEDGAPMPCTFENVLKMFKVNKGKPELEQWGELFREWVVMTANNGAPFRLADDEDGRGN